MVALAGNAVALHIHEEQCGGSIDERIWVLVACVAHIVHCS